MEEIEEITSSQVRLFGASPTLLELSPQAPLLDWAAYETGKAGWGVEDPKFIWEPARFGWALRLARAYHSTKDHQLAQFFWQKFEEFSKANPTLQGPNWASAQEVALRLIAFCLAANVFSDSPHTTHRRLHAIYQSIAVHAARIPPTLSYARAQGNNHLLSEASGLYTAGVFLPNHPMATFWRKLGWQTFHQALHQQISPDGIYAQHSLNYQRLMLDLSLWVICLSRWVGEVFPSASLTRLQAATRWLYSMVDPDTGLAPNLGSNDGAILLPLSTCSQVDFRPTLQASSLSFLGANSLPAGPWDELSNWLGLAANPQAIQPEQSSAINCLRNSNSRAYLRAVNFTSRPNHADQLHVDLWFQGQPVTLDAGTFRYSAPIPWNNSLAGTLCHNTLSVDGLDQMRRVGKFLWLDWAKTWLLPAPDLNTLVAETDAYRSFNISHRRTVKMESGLHWLIKDEVLPLCPSNSLHTFCLHWLLPDVSWRLEENTLLFSFPQAQVKLSFSTTHTHQSNIQLIRCAQLLAGKGDFPSFLGWYSPTYNLKVPALSVRFILQASAPILIQSDWLSTPTIE